MASFNIFETLAITFAIQSLLYIFFLMTSRPSKSNSILAIFLSLHVALLANLYIHQHTDLQIPYFYFEFVALLAPLQYLYVISITQREFRLSGKHLLSMIPFAIILLLRLIFYLTNNDFHSMTFARIIAVLLFMHVYSHLFLSFKRIRQFHHIILLTHSDFSGQNLKWIGYELLLLGVYFFLLGMESLSLFAGIYPFYETVIFLAFASLLMYINLLIYKSLRTPIATNGTTSEETAIATISKSKYANSTLSSELSRTYFAQLVNLMEGEKPYRQFDLSLSKLSRLMDLPPAILSQVINENANKNLNDFVNGYRVEEAKRMLHQDSGTLIKTVMYQCGFQSTSTFNNSFKKLTGQSPTAFAAQMSRSPMK